MDTIRMTIEELHSEDKHQEIIDIIEGMPNIQGDYTSQGYYARALNNLGREQEADGIPNYDCFPTEIPTSWSKNHVAISGILGIGRESDEALYGILDSQYMIDEWGYPDIGVTICDCPSAGYNMISLDYSHCGKDGELTVVHIDQEQEYRITYLADTFESFIKGLVKGEIFDE